MINKQMEINNYLLQENDEWIRKYIVKRTGVTEYDAEKRFPFKSARNIVIPKTFL